MKDFVTLANFRTKLEAEIVAGILEGDGIPFLIQSLEGSGIVPGPIGATIMVSPEDLAQAQDLTTPSEDSNP